MGRCLAKLLNWGGARGEEPSSRRAHMATLSSTSSCCLVHGEPVLLLRGAAIPPVPHMIGNPGNQVATGYFLQSSGSRGAKHRKQNIYTYHVTAPPSMSQRLTCIRNQPPSISRYTAHTRASSAYVRISKPPRRSDTPNLPNSSHKASRYLPALQSMLREKSCQRQPKIYSPVPLGRSPSLTIIRVAFRKNVYHMFSLALFRM